MRTDHILEDLVRFVHRKLPGVSVSGATDVRKDLPFDSLDQMELLAMIEQVYGVTVTPDEYLQARLDVLENLAAFIAERQTAHRR